MILSADGIRKRFEAGAVLRGATLEIRPGEIVVLVGANGSGKTTLARILATLLAPDAGQVTLDGEPVSRRRGDARRAIGFASHRPLLYLGLTPLENLTLFGGLSGVRHAGTRGEALLERLGMTPFARVPVERFSRGMLQRVVLARALLAEPAILLLDEPTMGLDDAGVSVVNEILHEAQARGAGSLVITHEPERVRGLTTRTLRMEAGRVEAGS